MINGKTITRHSALAALAELSNADRIISAKLGTTNELRTATIKRLEDELGVIVKTDQPNEQ